ncbi:MAG TPA: TMEM175 family protein [Ktedonobacteraceae bacterium]|nr:TMEM175 family protein [Ktedonobacteraceae bacterium]
MDTENESLPTGKRAPAEQQTRNTLIGGQQVKPVPRMQRITHLLEGFQPTPGSDVTRIYGLSDCVIAVAFTLFIVNIHLPPEGLNESQLQSFIAHNMLSGEIPFYLATYILVASSWISHYRIITYLKRSSSLFIILNVVFLASIVFLPVPVAFFYHYGNQAGSLLVFACTQLVTSVSLLLLWVVARVDHLLDPEMHPEYRSYTTARLYVIPIGTLLAIGVAFYNVWLAEAIFLFFYVLGWFLRGIFYRRHQRVDYLAGTTRMCSITDNMTAVAITFLITTITGILLSNTQQSFSTTLDAVLAELPVYSLSLLIVGFYWLSHHRIFMVIRRHNMTLIWLNFAFLLCIEFQPIFNNLHATYPSSQTATLLYASEQAATGLMLLVIWWYAAKGHRLIDKSMERFDIMFFAFRALLVPMVFILSIAIILFRNDLAVYFWLLVIVLEVADLVYRRVRRRSHKEDQLPGEADVSK